MSNTSSNKLKKGNTIIVNVINMIPGQELEVPAKSAKTINSRDIENEPMILTSEVGVFSYKVQKGVRYRVGEEGEKFPPIDEEKYNSIAKLREEEMSKEESASKTKTTKKKTNQKQQKESQQPKRQHQEKLLKKRLR